MESGRLETRLGPLAWQSAGRGPALVFFAGALANHDLWRDVVVAMEGRYRCITIDLPLGAHPWPLSTGADRSATSLCRAFPRLARALVRLQLRLQLRSPSVRRRGVSAVAASGLDDERAESFYGPAARDRQVAGDLVAAMAGFRPQLLIDAAEAIPRFDRPVLLIWGDACDFFPMAHARRLASDFPRATMVSVPGAKTWVPVDSPATVAGAIAEFVPTPVP